MKNITTSKANACTPSNFTARAEARAARMNAARIKWERLTAAANAADDTMCAMVKELDFEAAEAARAERDEYSRRAKNAAAAYKRVCTICAKEAAADEALGMANAADEAAAAAYVPEKPVAAIADAEARANARANADALTAEAARAARLADADALTADTNVAASATADAQGRRRAAQTAARLASDVDAYRAARAAEAAAIDALNAARADEAAALKREADRRAESIADHNARVESDRAAAARERAWMQEARRRADRAAANANDTAVTRKDEEERAARLAAGEEALTASVLTYQVALYPLDYMNVVKGIRRRADGASKLMGDALTAVCIHAENVTADSRAAAIHAALLIMTGDEADDVGEGEAAALAAAVTAAKRVKPADLTAACEEGAKKPAAVTAYENAVAVLEMVLTVRAGIVAADDAAQLYRAAVGVVQSSTRRAYNAVKGAGASVKGVQYGTETREGKAVGVVVETDRIGAARRYDAVAPTREGVLKEMYDTSRHPNFILRADTLVPDMIHDAILAALEAAADGVTDARAQNLAAHAAVNAILDGEGVRHGAQRISLEALTDAGYNPVARTPEEAAAAARLRVSIVAMVDACKPLMTERQRRIMQLTTFGRDEQGAPLTVAAIAAACDIKSKGTVGDIQNKAREILSAYALEHADEFSPAVLRAARALTAAAETRRANAAAKEARRRDRKKAFAK